MFLIKQFLLLLFASLNQINFLQNVATATTTSPPIVLNTKTNSYIKTNVNTNSFITQTQKAKISIISPDDTPSSETIADEIKNEVFVNDLLETVDESAVNNTLEFYQGPHYELNWDFVNKDTIRVTFDLFFMPTSLIENNIYSRTNKDKLNLLATMTTMPSRLLKSITSLEYFLFIIRPYNQNREIILKMEKLIIKNTTSKTYKHFSNSLRLTALNHSEKYSVCICYYQRNISIKNPDLLLCQDIINDYSKFAHLRTNPKHGLVFIITQYSIIIALLFVLQSVFTMRKRRIAQIIGHHFVNTAHTIRTTLSSVSLGRQSFSSLDAAAEQQQQHATKDHASRRESMNNEEGGIKKRIISSPAIVISEPSVSINNGATNSDETEPFLKRIPSKNHVHFLLGTGEEEEDGDNENEDIENNTTFNPQTSLTHREPYDDQANALLCMAHILDTNKPWSRHNDHTSPV